MLKVQPNTIKKVKKGQYNIIDSFKCNKKIPLNLRYKREDFLRDDLEFRKASFEYNLPAAMSKSEENTELPILFFESAYIYHSGQYARFVLVRSNDCALDWCKSNLKALDILHNPFFQYNPTKREVKSTSKSNNGRKLFFLDFLIVGNINLHMFSPLPHWSKVTKVRRAGREPIIGILQLVSLTVIISYFEAIMSL
ncbi:Hypothetical predicted protein [Mytilus galloprovincialis]|uniref:Uncharacterized protein n=1 Tax=Mytilus galloprovincialis TaxID=29158 RepID=A0A8B6H9S3_MYTGA|nr:Hypothetical predicted protein [Mytilus galloprovincialis]